MRTLAASLVALGAWVALLCAPARAAEQPPTEGTATTASASEPIATRCFRSSRAKPISGEPKTAFERQLCLRDTTVAPDGSLQVAIRYAARPGESAPALRLLSDDRPPGAAVPSRYEEVKTPVDVVAVIMIPKQANAPDYVTGLRSGLLALVEEAYRIPGSRFGLLGYSGSADQLDPRLPAKDAPLLPKEQSAMLRSTINELSLGADNQGVWHLKPAVDAAFVMFGLGKVPSPTGSEARRRHLVLFSNGFDYEPDTAAAFSELARRAAGGVTVTLISPPRYTGPVRTEVLPLVDGTGGLVHAARSNEEVEHAFRQIGAELHGQLVATFRLEQPLARRTGFKLALADDPPAQVPFVIDPPVSVSVSAAAAPEPGGAPRRFGQVTLLLLSALGGAGILLVLGLWLARSPKGSLHAVGAATPGLDPPSLSPAARVWLHWVDLGRDIPLDRLPHTLGNDLDCDTVILGVGAPRKRCEIRHEVATGSLYLIQRDRDSVQYGHATLTTPLKLEDGTEFLVNKQRFKLFITQLATLAPGGKS